ncbi:MAG: stage II sporulation protein M [Acidilobus sp.]
MGLLDDAIDEIAINRRLRLTWYLLIVVFGLSAAFVVAFYKDIMSTALGQYFVNQTQQIRQIASYVNVSTGTYAFLPAIIFAKNSLTDVLVYALLVTLVFPIIVLIFNGGLVGFVSVLTLPEHGNSLVIFYLLAPHGVIEIPAFALTAASMSLLRKGVGSMYSKGFGLLALSVFMLIVAAIVESTLTPAAGALVGLLTNTAP